MSHDQSPIPSHASLPASLPTVSIIIPAFNEQAVIERCLEAAADQTVPAHEILVIDNRSTDDTAALARRVAERHPRAHIRVIAQDAMQGLIPTRNAGFAAATGDVIGRIDADTVIGRGWVFHVARAMADPAIGAVSGPVAYYDLPFRGPQRISDDMARRALRRLGSKYPFLYGCNMAIRADAWRTIEHDACRDDHDRLHEDIDLSVHLFEAGLPVGYVSAMRADVSARRLTTSPQEFRDYTRRFERTYASHQINEWYLRAPQVLLQSVYWWARILRRVAPAPRTAFA